MRLIGWLFIVALAGCGSWRQEKPAPALLSSKYQFDYRVSNPAPISLIRVFDDGGNTYFQFRNSGPEELVISAETKTGVAVISHEIMGNYALIHGVYRQSSIATATQPVVARKLGAIAPMADIGPVVLPKAAPLAGPSKPLTVVNQEAPKRPSATHKIRFARNSARLGPKGRGDLNDTLAEARHASEAEIRVRPYYPARRASVRLAQARADTIRRALLAQGLEDADIRIDRQGALHALAAEVLLHERQAIREEVAGEALGLRTAANSGEHFIPMVGDL